MLFEHTKTHTINSMTRTAIFSLVFLCSLFVTASDLSELRNIKSENYKINPSWFIEHPLDGIYDVQVKIVQHPKQRGWGPTTSAVFTNKCCISYIKDNASYKVLFYDSKTGEMQFPSGNASATASIMGDLSQIGSSNAFNYIFEWSEKSCRVIIDNVWNFSFNLWLPQDLIEFTFGKYNGTDISYQMNFVKEYPTQSMISEVIAQSQRKQIEEALPTEWSGTCTAIGKDLVVTNYHVVENAKSLSINNPETDGNLFYTAQIVLIDKVNDLAVLRVTDSNFKGFKIKYGMKYNIADIGSDIFVLGYPLIETMGKDIKLTTGVISAKTGFQGDVSQYQISAAVQPGNSGGPLFDNKGNLIGIVSSKHRGTENVGYAIKLNYLKNLLDSSNSPITTISNNVISTLTLPEKIKAITPCVMIIKATCSN